MAQTVNDILEYQSLQKATLVTGTNGLSNKVTGVMVMEAPDIESWGGKGLIVLTSYFAMANMAPDKIDLFFRHAKRIGIAGFIVKVERLVETIPEIFVSSCEKYQIPLLQIGKDTHYEKIISEILESIINRNAFLLQNYYDIHKRFMRLMMNQPEISQILLTLESLIAKPVSLLEKVRGKYMGTHEELHDFEVTISNYLPRKDYMNLNPQRNEVCYKQYHPEKTYTQLSIPVPHLGYEEYELLVHELDHPVSDVEFMAIENTVGALQTELLKRFAMRQSSRSRLNELASDLLHGRLTTDEDLEETIYLLELDPTERYRIILFSFEREDVPADSYDPLYSRLADALIHYSKTAFPNRIYVTRKQKVILIVPAPGLETRNVKESMDAVMQTTFQHEVFQGFQIFATLSKEATMQQLPDAYQQAFDTQKILERIGTSHAVAAYEEMGIYQIFAETENLSQLERFIPEIIWTLRKENPEVLETLDTFINVNQNYSQTAQLLFVHPKTVRYRIERLKENYGVNLLDPEEILRYSVAMRLLKLLPRDYERNEKNIGGLYNVNSKR